MSGDLCDWKLIIELVLAGIGIRYDDEIRNYQDTKEYERQNNIFDFISEVSIKLEDNISKELNRGVRSIVYNDTSVIKRQNNEKEL